MQSDTIKTTEPLGKMTKQGFQFVLVATFPYQSIMLHWNYSILLVQLKLNIN